MANPDIKILPFDPQAAQEIILLDAALSKLYLPNAIFGDYAIRLGEETFGAVYVVRDFHCDPLRTPSLRGAISVAGNRTINTFTIDERENPEDPYHTEGHLRKIPLFPGHMGLGALMELANNDRAMDLVSFDEITFKGPGRPKETLVAGGIIEEDGENKKMAEGLVIINGREHAKGKNLVFAPSRFKPGNLPQFRWIEIGAQLAGAGLQTLIGPLPDGYGVVYDSIGSSIFIPDEIKPKDELRANVILFDMSRLTGGGYLFSLDLKLDHNQREIWDAKDICLGLLPEEKIIKAINDTITN